MKIWLPLLLALAVAPFPVAAACSAVPTYSYCDEVFEMTDEDAARHPNPYVSVDLWAEFRAPDFRTRRVFGFWDGGRKLVIRFTPTEPGEWTYRISSNVRSLDGKQGVLTAVASESPGFVVPANVHHWRYTERLIPHLWMGDTSYRMAFIDRGIFEQKVRTRAAQKFNHMRGLVIGDREMSETVFPNADSVNTGHFQELDYRVRFLNENGLVADLILGGDRNHLADLFPTAEALKRYVRYVVARYAPMNVTWQGVQEFEEYKDGRTLLRQIGQWLGEMDPYRHPRTTHTVATSAPLAADGWMDYILYQSSDSELGAIEHQLYARPKVNAEFGYEDSGAGKSHPHHVAADELRRRLWNSTVNGQYPTYGNTGTYGGKKFEVDVKYLDSPGARMMTVWYDFFAATRHWELEPYFDVDGGRSIALQNPQNGTEYIVYIEKPGPVEILVQRHSYQVYWFNPITGESIKEKKDFKGTRFQGSPPSQEHDWVLHLSRDGRKAGMLRSYKFESQRILKQEVESVPARVPFKIVKPEGDLTLSDPGEFAAEVTRETRATSEMMWVWTGEVPSDGLGYRVLGTGEKGKLRIPRGIAKKYPAILHIRLLGMNGVGKVYSLDQVVRLSE